MTLFYHLLNDQIQEVYAFKSKMTQKGLVAACNLNLRLAIALYGRTSIPTVDLVQSQIAHVLRGELEALAEMELVDFVGSTADPEELLLRKQIHYDSTFIHSEWSTDSARRRLRRFTPYLQRRAQNTTAGMKRQWHEAIHQADNLLVHPSRPDASFLAERLADIAHDSSDIENSLKRLERVPEDLGRHAFLRSVLLSLGVLPDLETSLDFSGNIDMSLANAWLRTHVDEFGPTYVARAVALGSVDCGLRKDASLTAVDLESIWRDIRSDTPARAAVIASGTAAQFATSVDRWRTIDKRPQPINAHVADSTSRPSPLLSTTVISTSSEDTQSMATPTNSVDPVFIGHGQSLVWREIKDFVADELKLEWDEFNRSTPTGRTAKERLEEMLNRCNFALLVLTAEDEYTSGAIGPRMNVVHEVGLFQGRLGFDKAIIVREEGCAEFSNLLGVQEIRFPTNNVKAAFYERGRVLR